MSDKSCISVEWAFCYTLDALQQGEIIFHYLSTCGACLLELDALSVPYPQLQKRNCNLRFANQVQVCWYSSITSWTLFLFGGKVLDHSKQMIWTRFSASVHRSFVGNMTVITLLGPGTKGSVNRASCCLRLGSTCTNLLRSYHGMQHYITRLQSCCKRKIKLRQRT